MILDIFVTDEYYIIYGTHQNVNIPIIGIFVIERKD